MERFMEILPEGFGLQAVMDDEIDADVSMFTEVQFFTLVSFLLNNVLNMSNGVATIIILLQDWYGYRDLEESILTIARIVFNRTNETLERSRLNRCLLRLAAFRDFKEFMAACLSRENELSFPRETLNLVSLFQEEYGREGFTMPREHHEVLTSDGPLIPANSRVWHYTNLTQTHMRFEPETMKFSCLIHTRFRPQKYVSNEGINIHMISIRRVQVECDLCGFNLLKEEISDDCYPCRDKLREDREEISYRGYLVVKGSRFK